MSGALARAAGEDFSALAASSAASKWLAELRRAGMDDFQRLGLPAVTDEDWRYTNLSGLGRRRFQRPSGDRVPAKAGAGTERGGSVGGEPTYALATGARAKGGRAQALAGTLVFFDGRFAPELSSFPAAAGVVVMSLAQALEEAPALVSPHLGSRLDTARLPLAALNTAFIEDGAFVHLADGAGLEGRLELVYGSSSQAGALVCHPRNLIVCGRDSRLSVVERYVAAGDRFTNAVTEIVMAAGARLAHAKVEAEAPGVFHLGRIEVSQGPSSRLVSHSISRGAGLARTEIRTVLDEAAEAELHGLYLARGSRHVDHHTAIEHSAPGGRSRERYKGIVDGEARGVFTGRVLVAEGATGTSAHQNNRNLLLSDSAAVDTRPQLEIYNDDVACTHGATVGRLDEDALFYLRSRGLDEGEARGLLAYAFGSEVLASLDGDHIRKEEDLALRRWLAGGGASGLGGDGGEFAAAASAEPGRGGGKAQGAQESR